MTNVAAAPQDKKIATTRKTLPELLNDPGTVQRFQDMLGKDARSFQQNILTVFNSGKALAECEPESIIAAAAISASINLSILPSLGQSCIVPYREGKDGPVIGQWQLMARGVIALAMRSEQYKKINLARVYEGQLIEYDEFKGTVTLNAKNKKSDRVQGYYFYFELLNGFTRESYWPSKKCIEHGLRYSKSFQKGGGKWAEDPEFVKAGSVNKWLASKENFLTEGNGADAMSAKTVVKNELTKWGILETRIREIINMDQVVVDPDGTKRYIDTTAEPATEPKTYTAPPTPSGEAPSAIQKLAWAKDAAFKQGVPHEQFDTWLAQQAGNDEVKADLATALWKKVAAKQATAAEVFKVAPASETATFKVYSVAVTDVGGEDAFVIRDTSEPAVKYYTEKSEFAEAAKIAKTEKKDFTVQFVMKGEGKTAYRWITQVA